MANNEILERLDEIIQLLKTMSKPPSVARRAVEGLATGAGILGILSAVDILRNWLGG
ncbi:MAG: hypothetical protein FWH19_04000 [Treponema sp.]|nr:hypothetical protein [Treponema sp.]